MTAFLFIPTTHDARLARRVDFANIASLFADTDEPAPRATPFKRQALRLAAMLVILVAIVGDTILVARPKLLATTLPATHEAAMDVLDAGA